VPALKPTVAGGWPSNLSHLASRPVRARLEFLLLIMQKKCLNWKETIKFSNLLSSLSLFACYPVLVYNWKTSSVIFSVNSVCYFFLYEIKCIPCAELGRHTARRAKNHHVRRAGEEVLQTFARHRGNLAPTGKADLWINRCVIAYTFLPCRFLLMLNGSLLGGNPFDEMIEMCFCFFLWHGGYV
jgi:hypothetical protein